MNLLSKLFLLIVCIVLFNSQASAQGVGSMEWIYKNDAYEKQMLTSLVFNGRKYIVRHSNLEKDKYQFNANTTAGYVKTILRSVEVFTTKDNGISWELAYPFPIFESVSSGGLIEVDLNLVGVENHARMEKINDQYFVLITRYRVKITGQTSNAYFPIIFLFRESIKEDEYPVTLCETFQPSLENRSEITGIQIAEKKATFNLNNGKKIFLTIVEIPPNVTTSFRGKVTTESYVTYCS